MSRAVSRLTCAAIVAAAAYHGSRVNRASDDGADRPAASSLGRRIVAEAKSQRGVPYSWGGGTTTGKTRGICCSPGGYDGRNTVGFDCSGLIQYAVHEATDGRVTLPRTAAEQVRRGRPVTRKKMRPGDLIGFDHGQGVTHIGIYIGGNKMVHAPHTGDVVKISPLAPRKNQRWIIRRLR
jgi:cell wall-associated NlpC family hydrolase